MPKSRVVRVMSLTAGGLVGLIALAILGASFVLQGPRLGSLIESSLPPNKGKLQIGGVTWHLRALLDIVTDVPSPISVDGLKIIDPEGTVVLDVPHLDARVKLRTLIGGSFSIHDLRIPKILWRFAKMARSEDIGFLAALEPKNAPPPKPKGAPAEEPKGPGSFFEIASAELGDLNAIFDFPGAWGLELRHAHARASLIQSAVDPKHPIFGFDVGPVLASGGGWLRILDDNVLPFDRVAITRVATTQDRPDDIFLDLEAAETGKSKLVGKGYFTGIYSGKVETGIKLDASFTRAADALGAVAAGKGIEGLTLSDGGAAGGEGATVVLDLHDSFAALKVAAKFRDLDIRYGDYRALGLGFDFGFDAGGGKLDVTRFGFGAPGGGRMDLDAHLDTTKLGLTAGVKLTGFRTDSYVPRELRAMAAGRLDGRIDATADLAHQSARIKRVDLRLARAQAAGLPRTVSVKGEAQVSSKQVKTSGLTVAVAGATATAKGEIELQKKLVQLGLEVVATDLGRLLGELGLPPLAREAHITAEAHGPLDAPVASGDAVVRGIDAGGRKLPELRARFGFQDGVARLDNLSGPVFGGTLKARGQLRLTEKRGRKQRPLKSPVVDLDLTARDLDIATLAGNDTVAGRLSLEAEAHGPLDALTARVRVPGHAPLTVLGDEYALGPVDVGLAGETLEVRALHVRRKLGGSLDVTGKMEVKRQDLAFDITLAKLPIEGLPGVAEAGVPVSGLVSAKLHVAGRPDRPELSGDIDFEDVVLRGTKLGKGHLVLAPVRVGPASAPGVSVRGRLFDRLDVDAQAALTPRGPNVHATVAFQRLVLEAILPELGTFADGRGVASGRVTVDVEPGKPLAVEVLLPELWLSIARTIEDANGETGVERVRVEAARPLHVIVNGDRVVLEEAHFSTNGGDLTAQGRLEGERISGAVSGHLDLELLQPFLRGQLERIGGDLGVELKASGTLGKPDLRGVMKVEKALRLRPKDFASDVVIGSGTIALDTDGVSVDGLAVTVEGSTMRLSGRAGLGPGFVPRDIQADLTGEMSAKLLAYVAPDAVSDARGTARVRAQVRGTMTKPDVRARLDLGTIDFRLRDMGTQVEVQSGIVEISNGGLVLHNVKVMLDDQGLLVIGASGVRAGRVQFTNLIPFKPGWIDLPLHGERLIYRSGAVEVDDLTFDLDLKGNVDDGFALGGEVRLVSGRYLQDFKVQNLVISPRVNESAVRPFYEGQPLLEDLGLDLTIRTVGEGFVVQNNIAPEIHVDMNLHMGGTLSEPALGGQVRLTDGRFNIPGMRGDFDLMPNTSNVLFVAGKSLADGDTPDINIEAQNQVTDANGVEHIVQMRIRGPVREAQIDLSTLGGLDRAQTALLLLTGRVVTDSQTRFGTQSPTVGANISTGADITGQLTRDTLANLMQPYIDDTFYKITGFNLRLTVGPDGFEGRIRKRVSRKLNFQINYLQGFQNQTHGTAQLDLWLRDYVTFGSGVERVTISSQQGVTETLPTDFNFELRLDYPIRRR